MTERHMVDLNKIPKSSHDPVLMPLYVAEDQVVDEKTAAAFNGQIGRLDYDVVEELAVGCPPVDENRIKNGWDIRTSYRGFDLDAIKAAIADDLAGGVTSIELDLDWGSIRSRRSHALEKVLEPVDFAEVPVSLGPHDDVDLAKALVDLAKERGTPLAAGSCLGIDPIGNLYRGGEVSSSTDIAKMKRAIDEADGFWEGDVLPMCVDVVTLRENGATWVQCLTSACYAASVYFPKWFIMQGGKGVSAGSSSFMSFRLPAEPDQIKTIAFLRAVRMLWYEVLTRPLGVSSPAAQYQHVVTIPSPVNDKLVSGGELGSSGESGSEAVQDEGRWAGVMGGTSAALAAGVGGADAITVTPTGRAGRGGALGDDLGRRLARNTHHLLLQEAHVNATTDPAAGSYAIECFTQELYKAGVAKLTAEFQRSSESRADYLDGTGGNGRL